MQITKLQANNWQEYKQLWLEALQTEPTAYYNIYAEKAADSDSEWQENFAQNFDNYYFALHENKPVGIAGYFISPRTKTNHIAEIVRVYVSPQFRLQGLGKQLLEHVITEIKTYPQITKIKIHAVASQTIAISLYQKLGFKEVGRFHNEINTEGVYYDEIVLEMMVK